MIKIDFYNTNKDVQLANFCEYFRLNKRKVLEFFEKNGYITVNQFVDEFKLNLNEYRSSDICIVCRHMTTAVDIKNFQSRGLLDLKTMLTTESPLSKFLLEHGVVVRVDDGILEICGESYSIKKYVGNFCGSQFENSMGNLNSKLYHFNATVEFFINATLDEMHEYQRIDKHPEFLETIDAIISSIPNQKLRMNLCHDWAAINKKCYVLEFEVVLSDMETYAPVFWDSAYDNYSDCFEMAGHTYDDYVGKEIPQSVLDNIYLIEKFLHIYFDDDREFGSLLPNGIIRAEKIKFIEVPQRNSY